MGILRPEIVSPDSVSGHQRKSVDQQRNHAMRKSHRGSEHDHNLVFTPVIPMGTLHSSRCLRRCLCAGRGEAGPKELIYATSFKEEHEAVKSLTFRGKLGSICWMGRTVAFAAAFIRCYSDVVGGGESCAAE
jgi:hypothetical protein